MKIQFLSAPLIVGLLVSCNKPPIPSRTADTAYDLRQIIRAQLLVHVHPCDHDAPASVTKEAARSITQTLESDRGFLQAVIGLKLLPPAARAQLIQDSRSIRVVCVGEVTPMALESEQELANAIVDLADRMADRVPGPAIESDIMKLGRKQ